jgi:hypothetical protein
MDVQLLPEGTTLQVQLRGTSWIFEAVSLNRMAARVDLKGAQVGTIPVHLNPSLLHPPPGIRVERVAPEVIQVQLIRH